MRTPLVRRPRALAALTLLAAAVPAVTHATIDASNVATLQVKWDFPLGAGVTSQPIVANGLLYVTSWNGFLYALDPDDGSIVWSFNTGSSGVLGVQSTPLITPGGDVCIGDSLAHVWCRDGVTGAPIWDKVVGNPVVDHVWSGLAAADGRLFVSIASHSDVPCTQGRLKALDLATGGDLWELETVPDMICTTDTSVTCGADSDCPAGGSCIPGLGGGVTATVSFDPAGTKVYMNTVGCYTYPSIGDSDTIFKLDAATGAVDWKTRVDAPEQFGACLDDPSIDCGTDADCPTGTCSRRCVSSLTSPQSGPTCSGPGDCTVARPICAVRKANYHDYGFLNGPIPVDVGAPVNKTLLISGSKNGTVYALDEATGGIEWFNEVAPKPVTPAFAAFGLFNGPLAVVDGRVHAALYDFSPPIAPVPEHVQAFDVTNGSTLWTDEMNLSWSGVGHANGLVYVGNNVIPELRAYNAATGKLLAELALPGISSSIATVDGETLYVGYGIFGVIGGVRAFEPDFSKCRRTVNKETAKFVQLSAKTLSKCELAKIKGKLPAATVCRRDDDKTVDKLAKAESKKIAKIDKACGGADKLCGGDLEEEVGAGAIGFGASCPGLEGLGQCLGGANAGDVCAADSDCLGGSCATCDTVIDPDTCTDATVCVDCIASVATHQMDDLLATGLVATDPSTQKDENKCQQAIQKEVWKFYGAKSKILQKCWDKRLLGKHGDDCPDQAAPAGSEARKAWDKIVKAESKKVAKICKACGGADKLCDGVDDIPVASIYSPVPTCPAVTLPGPPFTDCGAITIAGMQDLVDCLDCVAEFKIDCTAANQVPSVAAYPAACQ